MNTIHNNGDNDQVLNKDLDQLGQAYSSLEQDEPPEMLDQAILNSAHRAVEKKPHWMQFGWLHGLTTTAVVVLAFSIFLNQPETAPTFKSDMLSNKPSTLEPEKELKKQSINEDSDVRQKSMMESAPVLATPAKSQEELSELRVELPESMRAQQTIQLQGAELGKSERDDNDIISLDDAPEELMMDEVESAAGVLASDTAVIQASPSARSAPVNNAMKSRERTDVTIERELQTIIELKNAGNESWVTLLDAFKERYPDYELPDELKD